MSIENNTAKLNALLEQANALPKASEATEPVIEDYPDICGC